MSTLSEVEFDLRTERRIEFPSPTHAKSKNESIRVDVEESLTGICTPIHCLGSTNQRSLTSGRTHPPTQISGRRSG